MNDVLCIIPARGGSKGVPHKNVRPLRGKPLIAWSILQALAADCIDRVIVATDSHDIARVSLDYGAEVFWRSEESATDAAASEEAILECLRFQSTLPELTVFLQATSPVRQRADIDNAVQCLGHHDSVFSCRRVEGYTWTQGVALTRHCTRRKPRQEHTAVTLEENGSIYVFRTAKFLEVGDRICGRCVPYIMHPLDSFQIDEHEDFATVESILAWRAANADHVAASH